MNIVFKLLPLIFIANISANECATINFSPTLISNEKYVSIITTHNDEKLDRNDSKRDLIANKHNYHLAPGVHSLIIQEWPITMYRKVRRDNNVKNFKGNTDVFIHFVQLNVEKNNFYKFKVVGEKDKNRKVMLNSRQPKNCSADEADILTAKKDPKVNKENEGFQIPDNLEYRLRLLMNKLSTYHQDGSKTLGLKNIIPTRLNSIFGVFLDLDYVNSGKGLRVLSVSPYSLASRIKIYSGDIIVGLGRYKIKQSNKTPFQQFEEYLSSLYFGEKIIIKVIRNGKKTTLRGEYLPSIIPETKYTFSNITSKEYDTYLNSEHSTLPVELSIELDQLLIELADVFTSDKFEDDLVELIRLESFDNTFGLSGEKISLPKGVGLKVLEVQLDSIASYIGVKELDVILNINGKPLTDNNINETLRSLKTLDSGSPLSIEVLRDNKLVQLSGIYYPNKLVGFKLTLDLNSIKTVASRIKRLERSHKNQKRNGPSNITQNDRNFIPALNKTKTNK